jgi:hypothetical protein
MIDYGIVTGFLKTLYPGLTIILRDQNAQAPEFPYCTWFELVNVSKSRPESEYFDRAGQYSEKLTQNKVATIQVDFYTETISQAVIKEIQNYVAAGELADAFIIRAATQSSQVYQRQNDIGVLDWTDSSRFSQFLGDNSEARAMMEFKLNNTQVHEENASAIDTDTIDINLTLEGLQ